LTLLNAASHCRKSEGLQRPAPPARLIPYRLMKCREEHEFSVRDRARRSAIPITFATKATGSILSNLPRRPGNSRSNGFAGENQALASRCPPRTTDRASRLRLEDETSKNSATRSGPVCCWPVAAGRLSLRPMHARHARLAVLASRSALSIQPLPAKADTPDVRLVRPNGIDVAVIARTAGSAVLARDLHQHAGKRHGTRRNWRRRRSTCKALRPTSTASVGDDLTRQNFRSFTRSAWRRHARRA